MTSKPRGEGGLFSLPGGGTGSSTSYLQVYAGLCVRGGCRKQEGRSMKRKGMVLPLIEPGPQHRRKVPSFWTSNAISTRLGFLLHLVIYSASPLPKTVPTPFLHTRISDWLDLWNSYFQSQKKWVLAPQSVKKFGILKVIQKELSLIYTGKTYWHIIFFFCWKLLTSFPV